MYSTAKCSAFLSTTRKGVGEEKRDRSTHTAADAAPKETTCLLLFRSGKSRCW